MEQMEIEALVQNCIEAYNWIKEEVGEVDWKNASIGEMKRLLNIPGFGYWYDFGRIKETWERMNSGE